jgi:putative ABC transport system substrate-binding protein
MVVAFAVLAFAGAAEAQPAKTRVGVLLAISSKEEFDREFSLALRALGYVDGRNVVLEYRSAAGNPDKLAPFANELVRLKVNVLVTETVPAADAAARATKDIPIVMATAGDPVAAGLVASLARPGGNVTGLSATTSDVAGKLLQLLGECRPGLTRVAVVVRGRDAVGQSLVASLRSAAEKVGVRVQAVTIRNDDDLDGAFKAITTEHAGAIVIQPAIATTRVAELALKHRLPSITTGSLRLRSFPRAGGLMVYGVAPEEFRRQAAVYVDKILKGARPADLPVQQPTAYQLVINLKTAKALGLTIPPSLLQRADDVIR